MTPVDLWERARRGQHTLLLGVLLPALPQDLRVVRVSCDVPPTTLGPLLDARDRVERILGTQAPLAEIARSGVMTLRRHLLGDLASATNERSLVDVCNRLAALGPAALVLDAVDAADPATLDMLRHILGRPGWLRLPVVLVMRAVPLSEAASSLVAVVGAECGEEAIVKLPAKRRAEPPATDDVAPPVPQAFDARALPPEVLRVLRGLAVAGSGCEAQVLAAVLERSELEVLEALQHAADAGVPVEDRGEGRFHLPEVAVAAIRATILPSLAAALHRRLASILADEPPAPPSPPLFEPEIEEHPRPGDAWDVLQAEKLGAVAPSARNEAPPSGSVEPSAPTPEPAQPEALSTDEVCQPTLYKPFSGRASQSPSGGEPRAPVAPAEASPAASTHGVEPAPRKERVGAGDDARAARHLAAAGDAEPAIERYVEAMQKAAEASAYPQAVAHARTALALLERLPRSDARRLQTARVLLETARVVWHGTGPDATFTLPGALGVAESARASLRVGDPTELVADVAVTIAGILYEIGDLESLVRADTELNNASRALASAGQPRAATRLFNDQASVLIRLGDPVRAAHLLTESRKIFEPTAKTDPVAMAEMAETDHLFARILLRVPARPGRESDALSLGLDHALAAERAFQKLGAPREAARVLETMGRIELRRNRPERAAERVIAALQIQESVGDLVGLARSTAALSEVFAGGGKVKEALSLLGDSIALNFEKRSPLGIAFNRKALESFATSGAARDGRGELVGALEAQLLTAEKTLGRIAIPGSAAPPRETQPRA